MKQKKGRFNAFILMAVVKFGGGISEIRGSIAGSTFSRNSSGAIIRQKVTPVNPNTVKQSASRLLFGATSSSWRSLSDADRASFNTYAPDYTRINVFGDNVPLTGQQLFMKLRQNQVQQGMATVDTCIPPVDVPGTNFTAIDADVSDGTITITALGATNANQVIGVYATAPYSAGKTYTANNLYRYIQTKPVSTAAGDLDITAAYEAATGLDVGSMAVGTRLSVKVIMYDTRNGQPSAAYSQAAAVVA